MGTVRTIGLGPRAEAAKKALVGLRIANLECAGGYWQCQEFDAKKIIEALIAKGFKIT